MELDLREKIDRNIDNYFPGKNFSISSLTRVKTKPHSFVFNALLVNSDGEHEEIYIKQYAPEIKSGIRKIINLKTDWDQILTPRIIDYFEGDNVVLFEGVKGDTLSKNLLLNSYRLSGNTRESRLFECARKMGNAIGLLQKLTENGSQKIGESNIFIVEQFESEEYVKEVLGTQLWTDVRPSIEQLKDTKTTLAQLHGDPSPHNIILRGNDVFLLDFCYQTNAVFLDPVLFIVSLDLMRARLPFVLNSTITQMKTIFLRAYGEATNETWDRKIWSLFEFLTYLHVLLKYETRHKSLKNYIVASLDKRYILNKIRNFTQS
jgi:tRNA A-37 threonylcarbamoyl transferase component Bud32